MSGWAFGLVYVLSLPVSVWFLAGALALVDEPDKTRPLVRLVVGICIVLLVLILTNRSYLLPLGMGFLTVTLIHTTAFFGFRKAALGVPIHEEAPPPIPLVEEREEEEEDSDIPRLG